jgi:hypothetical protein
MGINKALRGPRAVAVASVVAVAAGVAVAAALPAGAGAAGGITVQAAAVPGGGTAQDGIVQGTDGQEWFIVQTASGFALDEANPAGTLTGSSITTLPATGLKSTTQFIAMATTPNAPGFVWALGETGGLYSISADGSTATKAGVAGIDNHDMTVGPDGNLYATDHLHGIDKYTISSNGSASSTSFNTGAATQPDAIASDGVSDLIWSDDGGNLWYTTTNGVTSSVYSATVSDYPHTMVVLGGNLWAVGYQAGHSNQILEMTATYPYTVENTYTAAGVSAITSLMVGPDGDLWFPEAGTTPEIGQMDPASGAITQHPLPSGFAMPTPAAPPTDAYAIGAGPNNTLWFTAQTSGGVAAVGEVSGFGSSTTTSSSTTTTTNSTTTTSTTTTTTSSTSAPPAPPTLRVARSAKVSRKGIASVKVSCAGPPGATCTGRLSLSLVVIKHHKRKTVGFGSARYTVATGRSHTLGVRLSGSGKKLLKHAHKHKLVVSATARPTGGNAKTSNLTLAASKPKKKKKKR